MVKPIPDGYHSITPYLVVNNGVEAIEFYKRAFGAVEEHRHSGLDGKAVINSRLRIGDSSIPVIRDSGFDFSGGSITLISSHKSSGIFLIVGRCLLIGIHVERTSQAICLSVIFGIPM